MNEPSRFEHERPNSNDDFVWGRGAWVGECFVLLCSILCCPVLSCPLLPPSLGCCNLSPFAGTKNTHTREKIDTVAPKRMFTSTAMAPTLFGFSQQKVLVSPKREGESGVVFFYYLPHDIERNFDDNISSDLPLPTPPAAVTVQLETIRHVGILYQPFVPDSAGKLLDQLGVPEGNARLFTALEPDEAGGGCQFSLQPGAPLDKPVPVFPRIEAEDVAAPAAAAASSPAAAA